MLLSAPDSLVVSISKNHGFSADEETNAATLVSTPRKSRGKSFGIDGLDLLNFAYKVHFLAKHDSLSLSLHAYYTVVHYWCFSLFFLNAWSLSFQILVLTVWCVWMLQVSWPLELIFNMEAIKKYNQVAVFASIGIWNPYIASPLECKCSVLDAGHEFLVEGQACKICAW